jgi:hypothetical protein
LIKILKDPGDWNAKSTMLSDSSSPVPITSTEDIEFYLLTNPITEEHWAEFEEWARKKFNLTEKGE